MFHPCVLLICLFLISFSCFGGHRGANPPCAFLGILNYFFLCQKSLALRPLSLQSFRHLRTLVPSYANFSSVTYGLDVLTKPLLEHKKNRPFCGFRCVLFLLEFSVSRISCNIIPIFNSGNYAKSTCLNRNSIGIDLS